MAIGGHNPGSSLRCNECKQRRKKCDLQQPRCLRCIRSGIACSGPRRDVTIFVNRSANAFSAQTQRSALVGALRDRNVDGSTPSKLPSYQTAADEIEVMKRRIEKLTSRSALTVNNAVLSSHKVLVGTTYAALLEEFQPTMEVGIFSGDRMPPCSPRHYSTHATCIRSLLPLAFLSNPGLDQCTISLLALYYGRLHGDQELVNFARSSYTVALDLVRRQLDSVTYNAERMMPISMFMSMALLIYEHLDDVDVFGQGHLAHVYGALELLRSYGPASLRDSPELWRAFCGLRSVAAFTAIEDRQHTFLAEPEWLTVQHKSVTKSARDRLIDLALEIPSLLRSADDIISSVTLKGKKIGSRLIGPALSLINEFAALHRKLEEWLYDLRISREEPLFWSRNEPTTFALDIGHELECKPKDTAILHKTLFQSAPIAGLLVHLWSFQLSLFMTSIDLQKSLLRLTSSMSSSDSDLRLASSILSSGLSTDCASAEEIASLFLEAQPYLSSCLEGLFCLQFPLRIVQRYFERPAEHPNGNPI